MRAYRWDARLAQGALLLMAALAACSAGNGQATQQSSERRVRPVAGCEGCEAAWERDLATLSASIDLAGPHEPGERLVLRGTVWQPDGSTPAPGVVLYLHQTNSGGLYAGGNNDSEWSRRHGRLRAWLKTGADGRYQVRTIKPGRYPDRTDPAHIHITVLEPGKDPYWIDDVVFAGEPGVDAAYRQQRENRGGTGIVQLSRNRSGTLLARRDIVLER